MSAHALAMDRYMAKTPFDLLLTITGLMRPEDMKSFLPCIPFLKDARWVSGAYSVDSEHEVEATALPGLIFGLASRLADQGVSDPERVLAFVIADWEAMEVVVIEETLSRLGRCYPKAQIEALWLQSADGPGIEVILAAK